MKIAIAALAVVLVAAAAVLIPVQPYQDFQVVYHADMGLLRGIALYDQPGQVQMIAEIAGVPAERVYVLPFPYPPWYALSTFWLALLPVATAARVWFALNLLMLLASFALLRREHTPLRTALMLAGAIFWLPVMGSLLVGQYGFPVLLGAAMTAYALESKRPILLALAMILLSFKPHLGAFICLLILIALWLRRDEFSRRAALALAVGATVLVLAGFLASASWPIEYVRSLAGFSAVHGVPQCTQCVSLPVLLTRSFGGGLGAAVLVALGLSGLACAWVVWRWRVVSATAAGMVSTGILITLLVSPYLLNYDYLLLLVPLIALADQAHAPLEWLGLGLAYLVPAAAFVLWGAAGNAALVASALIVMAVSLAHPVKVRAAPAA